MSKLFPSLLLDLKILHEALKLTILFLLPCYLAIWNRGKAVYESLLVEPQFSYPFLNQLLGQQNTLDGAYIS